METDAERYLRRLYAITGGETDKAISRERILEGLGPSREAAGALEEGGEHGIEPAPNSLEGVGLIEGGRVYGWGLVALTALGAQRVAGILHPHSQYTVREAAGQGGWEVECVECREDARPWSWRSWAPDRREALAEAVGPDRASRATWGEGDAFAAHSATVP